MATTKKKNAPDKSPPKAAARQQAPPKSAPAAAAPPEAPDESSPPPEATATPPDTADEIAAPEALPADADDGSSTHEALQAQFDEAEERGFIGVEVDPTPNKRYAMTSEDFRTPESDPETAKKAGSSKFAGVDEEAK